METADSNCVYDVICLEAHAAIPSILLETIHLNTLHYGFLPNALLVAYRCPFSSQKLVLPRSRDDGSLPMLTL